MILFTACRNEPSGASSKILNTIPQNALSITEIDVPSILEKMDFESVKQMEFYQEMAEDAGRENPIFKEVLLDPNNSGIDLSQKQYIASVIDEKSVGNSITLMIAAIANESAFAKLLDNAGLETKKEIEGYNYVKIDRKTAIVYNDETAIIANSNTYGSGLEKAIIKVLQTTPDNAITNDKDLIKQLSKKHDINSWVSTNPLAENKDFTFYASMINLEKEDLKNNYIHSHLDFEKGAIKGVSDYSFTDKIEEEFGLFIKDQTGTKFDQLIPADQLIYNTSMALNVDGIKTFITRNGTAKSFINFALMEYGLKLDDLAAIFDGDMSIAAYTGQSKKEADGLVLIKVKDQDKLEKILELGEEFEVLSKITKDHYKLGFQSVGPNFNAPFGGSSQLKTEGELLIKDGMIYISSSSNIIEQIRDEDFRAASKEGWAKELLRNSSFSTFVDFNNIAPIQESLEGEGLDQLKIVAKDGQSTMHLQMKDDNINSLKALMEMINKAYLKEKGNSI